jgi:ribosomal protein S18 acetylase RimI-like enzyme
MTIIYRKGTAEDSYAVFQVFSKSIIDLGERTNVMAITGGNHPEVLQSLWSHRKFLFEYLAMNAAQFWVAEEDGKIIGYARSIEHDGLMDLTEFFVLPDQQSAGVGRELMARAFPETDTHHRIIVATMDERALNLYLRSGVYARFPIKYFSRKAEKVKVETDLVFEPLQIGLHLDDLNRIDQQIIGHSRADIHRWIATTRDGFVCKRNGEAVGYGYVGGGNGPFALLDETDYRAVLAHAESLMAEKGEEFGAETPFINKSAIQYFLERKYRIDSFTVLFMSNEPFGKFENYLCFSPIFFM